MAATETWCKTCKRWIPKASECDTCGNGQRFNKGLSAAKLNAHLYAQADQVRKEKTDSAHFVREARREAKRVGG